MSAFLRLLTPRNNCGKKSGEGKEICTGTQIIYFNINYKCFASWGIERNPRCSLLTKYRYTGTLRQCVSSSLQSSVFFTPLSKTKIIKLIHLNLFFIVFLIDESLFLITRFLNFFMELKSCPSLKGNERHPFHSLWLLERHTGHSEKRKHSESYWYTESYWHIESYWHRESYWNSQRNSHRQEKTSIASAFLPHTCKDTSRLFSLLLTDFSFWS